MRASYNIYEIPLQSARYIHVQTRDGLGLKLACLMIHGLGKTDSGYNN